jgi:ribosome-associated protein
MTKPATDLPESSDALRLDHFLKINSISESGGHAKAMIQGGEVKLNGQVETRRRKKLAVGDIVEVHGRKIIVTEYIDTVGE